MKITTIFLIFSLISSCKLFEINKSTKPTYNLKGNIVSCDTLNFDYTFQKGCDGKTYPNPRTSPYVLPYLSNVIYTTGLTNCSSSYHGSQYPDRYAYDFDMPIGSNFYACRGGVVAYVREDQSSNGGESGNWCVIDHLDNTFGIYLHSPKNEIYVEHGDTIKQGDLLGKTGKSGLAGYPHLHFIVTKNGFNWPYEPIPITFRNNYPADVTLKSYTKYLACKYKN